MPLVPLVPLVPVYNSVELSSGFVIIELENAAIYGTWGLSPLSDMTLTLKPAFQGLGGGWATPFL
jgi:hypothetical protein